MNTKSTPSILVFYLLSHFAFSQNWQWAKTATSESYSVGNAISSDKQGNFYVTGSFYDSVSFDSFKLKGNKTGDFFITKYAADGSALWANKLGIKNVSASSSANCTDSKGNVYVTGFVQNPNYPAVDTIKGLLVAKYNTTGTLLSVFNVASYSWLYSCKAIAVDSSKNIVIAGSFKGSITLGTTTLTSSVGYYDGFVVKLDSAGNVKWVKQLAGLKNDEIKAVSIDKSGHICVTGYFTNSATLGNITITSNAVDDIFIGKYNADGIEMWAKNAGSNQTGVRMESGNGISNDSEGNVYVTGNYSWNAYFGTVYITGNGSSTDIFIAKYSNNGDIQWVRRGQGAQNNEGRSIATDAEGNSFVTGTFVGKVSFDKGTGTSDSLLTIFSTAGTTGYNEIYVVKYNTDGKSQWIRTANGPAQGNDFNQGNGICLGDNNNIYTTGEYSSRITFGTTTFGTNANYKTKTYVAMISENITTALVNPSLANIQLSVYPNPSDGNMTINLEPNQNALLEKILVFDINGKLVYSENINNQSSTYDIKIGTIETGSYMLQLFFTNRVVNKKLIIK